MKPSAALSMFFLIACFPAICLADQVLFSIAFKKDSSNTLVLVRTLPTDTLVIDALPGGALYLLHGKRLVIIAPHAIVSDKVVIQSFDDSDVPANFDSPAPAGATGYNGQGQDGGGKGKHGGPGLSPEPLKAKTGTVGKSAKEVVLNIGDIVGGGSLTVINAGGKGGKGQTGGEGGTGGQGDRGVDGDSGLTGCNHGGGNGGDAGPGGTGGTGGDGGSGGPGGIVMMSPAVAAQIGKIVAISVKGGSPGDAGDAGAGGHGGPGQSGGSGVGFCGGGHGTDGGPPGDPGKPGGQMSVGLDRTITALK